MTFKDKLSKIYNDFYQNHKINILVNKYKEGGIKKLSKHLHQLDIYSYSSLIEKDLPLYEEISSRIFEYTENKLKSKDIINVGFVIHSASMWSCEKLYRFFESDPHFNPSVIVSRCNSDASLKTYPLYNKTLSFFNNSEYNVKTLNLNDNRFTCWKKMGEPDILFYLSPYNLFTPKEVNIKYMPADVLTIYIPYCYMMNDSEGLRNCPGIMYTWKHFVESKFYLNIFSREKPYRKNNLEFLGYPKMDYFYKNSYDDTVWKEKQKKRIIYAPHHSIGEFSTFRDNGLYFLELAKKYEHTTTWVIKPHPLLGRGCVRSGVFKTSEEYDHYLDQWRNLKNANVIEEGTYEDIFMTSDAMICDSMSFLAEYQFTHKPLLFLENKSKLNFDDFGFSVYKQLYTAEGTNKNAIDKFITDVVLNENDPMKSERDVFFKEYLDNNNNGNSSYLIYKYICDKFNKICYEQL